MVFFLPFATAEQNIFQQLAFFIHCGVFKVQSHENVIMRILETDELTETFL
jgi:hypothetical protein